MVASRRPATPRWLSLVAGRLSAAAGRRGRLLDPDNQITRLSTSSALTIPKGGLLYPACRRNQGPLLPVRSGCGRPRSSVEYSKHFPDPDCIYHKGKLTSGIRCSRSCVAYPKHVTDPECVYHKGKLICDICRYGSYAVYPKHIPDSDYVHHKGKLFCGICRSWPCAAYFRHVLDPECVYLKGKLKSSGRCSRNRAGPQPWLPQQQQKQYFKYFLDPDRHKGKFFSGRCGPRTYRKIFRRGDGHLAGGVGGEGRTCQQ